MISVLIFLIVVFVFFGFIFSVTDADTPAGDLACVLFLGTGSLMGVWAIIMFLVGALYGK